MSNGSSVSFSRSFEFYDLSLARFTSNYSPSDIRNTMFASGTRTRFNSKILPKDVQITWNNGASYYGNIDIRDKFSGGDVNESIFNNGKFRTNIAINDAGKSLDLYTNFGKSFVSNFPYENFLDNYKWDKIVQFMDWSEPSSTNKIKRGRDFFDTISVSHAHGYSTRTGDASTPILAKFGKYNNKSRKNFLIDVSDYNDDHSLVIDGAAALPGIIGLVKFHHNFFDLEVKNMTPNLIDFTFKGFYRIKKYGEARVEIRDVLTGDLVWTFIFNSGNSCHDYAEQPRKHSTKMRNNQCTYLLKSSKEVVEKNTWIGPNKRDFRDEVLTALLNPLECSSFCKNLYNDNNPLTDYRSESQIGASADQQSCKSTFDNNKGTFMTLFYRNIRFPDSPNTYLLGAQPKKMANDCNIFFTVDNVDTVYNRLYHGIYQYKTCSCSKQ